MNIAIYSGSFNPVHNGHLAIAEAAHAAGYEEVWMVVSPQNPHKSENELWPFQDRFRMVELAIANYPFLKASDCENQLSRPSYTIHTLEFLGKKYPQHHFRLLIGGDNIENFQRWKAYQRIIDQFGLLVYPRSQVATHPLQAHPNVQYLMASLLDISSSEIRERVVAKQTISHLVPASVEKFLHDKGIISKKE